jgi:outer membrane immunogenic protein
MRITTFALIAASGMATPALAQQAAPFTGARAEGIIGWDRLQANGEHSDDVAYGIAGGYDVQRGGLLIGIEGELTDSTGKTCAGAETVVSPRYCAKAARDLYVGGRVGKVVGGGNTLLYAKAGYTNARFKATSDDGTTQTTLFRDDLDGFRLGAGAEYAIGPNSFVKAEYRYSNYSNDISRNQIVGGFGFRF